MVKFTVFHTRSFYIVILGCDFTLPFFLRSNFPFEFYVPIWHLAFRFSFYLQISRLALTSFEYKIEAEIQTQNSSDYIRPDCAPPPEGRSFLDSGDTCSASHLGIWCRFTFPFYLQALRLDFAFRSDVILDFTFLFYLSVFLFFMLRFFICLSRDFKFRF